jgi:hypothetical protein
MKEGCACVNSQLSSIMAQSMYESQFPAFNSKPVVIIALMALNLS